jgi:hypothetical protein
MAVNSFNFPIFFFFRSVLHDIRMGCVRRLRPLRARTKLKKKDITRVTDGKSQKRKQTALNEIFKRKGRKEPRQTKRRTWKGSEKSMKLVEGKHVMNEEDGEHHTCVVLFLLPKIRERKSHFITMHA